MITRNVLVLIAVISMISCGSCKSQKKGATMNQNQMDEHLIEVNKQLIKDDKLMIDRFVSDNDWTMKSTGTGLRYWIYEEGTDTTLAKKGMTANVNYELSLLDGTLCHKTPAGEYESFVIGHADVATGLHEMVSLMTPGDKAKVILPPHLAYGLTGDMGKIPLHSVLVYDLTLIALK